MFPANALGVLCFFYTGLDFLNREPQTGIVFKAHRLV